VVLHAQADGVLGEATAARAELDHVPAAVLLPDEVGGGAPFLEAVLLHPVGLLHGVDLHLATVLVDDRLDLPIVEEVYLLGPVPGGHGVPLLADVLLGDGDLLQGLGVDQLADLGPLLLLPPIQIGAEDLAGLEVITGPVLALGLGARRGGLAGAALPLRRGGQGEEDEGESEQEVHSVTHGETPGAGSRMDMGSKRGPCPGSYAPAPRPQADACPPVALR